MARMTGNAVPGRPGWRYGTVVCRAADLSLTAQLRGEGRREMVVDAETWRELHRRAAAAIGIAYYDERRTHA